MGVWYNTIINATGIIVVVSNDNFQSVVNRNTCIRNMFQLRWSQIKFKLDQAAHD